MSDSQSAAETRPPVALIVGAGDAIGSAVLSRFCRGGLTAVGVRRDGDKLQSVIEELTAEGLRAHGWSCDARDEEAMVALFDRIETEVGPLEVVVFNIGANMPMTIANTPARTFRKLWEMGCFAGFLCGREAGRVMQPRGKGTLIFTGATASKRGAAGFGAFASAKHGLRAVAESLARELGPQGIHVAHVIIDAMVDTAFIQNILPAVRPERQEADIVDPASVAEHYWQLHRQTRDAWTFESDLRPWCEQW